MNFHLGLVDKTKKPVFTSKALNLLNRFLIRYNYKLDLVPVLDHALTMVSFYQKMNFYHLLNQVILNKIPGDVVECGCFEGQTALLMQNIINDNKSEKQLILYDNFRHQIGLTGDIKTRLINNFSKVGFELPKLIEGSFSETIPLQLPKAIAFLHIDCGFGGEPENHKKVVLHCLISAYPKMSKGAVGILMDYHDNEHTVDGFNSNPGVKLACDEFFADKPEHVFTLYGGEYSHGYFVKE